MSRPFPVKPAETIWTLFEASVQRWPENYMTFSVMGQLHSITLQELHDNSLRLAAALQRAGLRPGDTIAAQLPHCAENVTAILASAALGLIFVPVVHILGAAELRFIVASSGARMLLLPLEWYNYDYPGRARDAASIATLETIVMTGGAAPGVDKVRSWDDLIAGIAEAPQLPRVDPELACLMLFTSGTTSAPKGVLHNHRTLAAEARQIAPFLDGLESTNVLVAAPAGHIGGISSLLRQFMLGINGVWLDRWDGARAVELIERHQVTWSAGVPFYLNALIPWARGGGIPTLKRFMVGGTGVAPALIEQAELVGIAACRSYGSTEHPTISQCLSSDPLDKRKRTDGRLGPGCSIRLVDENGREVAAGMPGEIVSLGDELFLGYFDASHNAGAFADDGGFHTGDIGVMDEDGYLTIVDRKKDIIIRGGENISSRQIEDALLHHPAVRDAAAIGWPDALYGERIGVFVVLHDGASLTLESVHESFASQGLPRQKYPERMVIAADFPRNSSGKVLKGELRKRAIEIHSAEGKVS